MNTALSLSPLFRSSVGFDRFNDIFDTLVSETESKPAFPPYDIIKTSENTYEVVMAVAGYKQADINITLEQGTLKVIGSIDKEENEETTYLHRGIAKRAFERKFRLDDNVHVTQAKLEDGLLSIHLKREIPEEKKPQIIPINDEQVSN